LLVLSTSLQPLAIFAKAFSAVLTYKVLCGAAPWYLGPLNRTADMADRRPLCSSATNRLVVPPYRLSSVGSRAFPVAAVKIWNALPDNLSVVFT